VKGNEVLIISVGWDEVAFEPTSPSSKLRAKWMSESLWKKMTCLHGAFRRRQVGKPYSGAKLDRRETN